MNGLLTQIHTGYQQLPRRVMIYGPHGIGKSTLCRQADEVIHYGNSQLYVPLVAIDTPNIII